VKLIPTKKELTEGWDGPLHFGATFMTFIYHIVAALAVVLLFNFVGVLLFNAPLLGSNLASGVYGVTFLVILFLQLLAYKRLFKQEFYQYCKSILIVSPLFWILIFVIFQVLPS
jgi:hypothetical protein